MADDHLGNLLREIRDLTPEQVEMIGRLMVQHSHARENPDGVCCTECEDVCYIYDRTHLKNLKPSYTCDTCGSVYCEACINNTTIKTDCPECGIKFGIFGGLDDHPPPYVH